MDNDTIINIAGTADQASEIRERFARYQPKSLSVAQRTTLLDPMREAVLAANPRNEKEAQTRMSILAGFVHDGPVSPIRFRFNGSAPRSGLHNPMR